MKTDWDTLLKSLPGYDPYRGAEGCWFDPKAAARATSFIEECLTHVEGALAGKPFLLEPWQKAVVANLFGWKRKDEFNREVRRYREVFLYVARKNGKTPLVGAICLAVFFLDGEAGFQGYIAAGEREQAGLLFRHVKGMVLNEPELKKRCRIYGGNAAAGQSKSIVREQDMSYLRVIAADADTQHGGNTSLAAVDELHVQPDRDLVDVLTTSMASANRAQPLLFLVTTADYDRESICNEKYNYAGKVRDGIIDDPSFLPVMYEVPRDADWSDEEVWKLANPNLGVSVSLEYLRREFKKAKEIPAYENTFRRLHLNQKTEQDVRAIPMDKWDACGTEMDPWAWREAEIEKRKGHECIAALDIGATGDLTALAVIFSDWTVIPYFWIPRDNAEKRERRDRVPYVTWARQGWVNTTGGNSTDYPQVKEDIVKLGSHFQVRQLPLDRLFQGAWIASALLDEGFDVVEFGQGHYSMAAPVKHFMELILNGQLKHGGNPVLRWMAGNAAAEQDAAGNLKFSKKKSTERIDGIVATVMAVGMALQDPLAEETDYTVRWL